MSTEGSVSGATEQWKATVCVWGGGSSGLHHKLQQGLEDWKKNEQTFSTFDPLQSEWDL